MQFSDICHYWVYNHVFCLMYVCLYIFYVILFFNIKYKINLNYIIFIIFTSVREVVFSKTILTSHKTRSFAKSRSRCQHPTKRTFIKINDTTYIINIILILIVFMCRGLFYPSSYSSPFLIFCCHCI